MNTPLYLPPVPEPAPLALAGLGRPSLGSFVPAGGLGLLLFRAVVNKFVAAGVSPLQQKIQPPPLQNRGGVFRYPVAAGVSLLHQLCRKYIRSSEREFAPSSPSEKMIRLTPDATKNP